MQTLPTTDRPGAALTTEQAQDLMVLVRAAVETAQDFTRANWTDVPSAEVTRLREVHRAAYQAVWTEVLALSGVTR